MRRLILKNFNRLSARLTFVAVVCNFVIPIGYMPAAFADGGPVQLCPSGWPSGSMPGHDGHHGHDGHSSGDEAWEHCAYGAASSSPALVGEHEISVARFSDVPDERVEHGRVEPRALLAFRSRAPPLTTPQSH